MGAVTESGELLYKLYLAFYNCLVHSVYSVIFVRFCVSLRSFFVYLWSFCISRRSFCVSLQSFFCLFVIILCLFAVIFCLFALILSLFVNVLWPFSDILCLFEVVLWLFGAVLHIFVVILSLLVVILSSFCSRFVSFCSNLHLFVVSLSLIVIWLTFQQEMLTLNYYIILNARSTKVNDQVDQSATVAKEINWKTKRREGDFFESEQETGNDSVEWGWADDNSDLLGWITGCLHRLTWIFGQFFWKGPASWLLSGRWCV